MTIEDLLRDAVEALDEQWQDPEQTASDYQRFLERAGRTAGPDRIATHTGTLARQANSEANADEIEQASDDARLSGPRLAVGRLAARAPQAAITGTAARGARHSERGWFKSSFSSTTTEFVEVRLVAGAVAVRDSKDPAGPVLVFTPDEWAAFLLSVRDGDFDLP